MISFFNNHPIDDESDTTLLDDSVIAIHADINHHHRFFLTNSDGITKFSWKTQHFASFQEEGALGHTGW